MGDGGADIRQGALHWIRLNVGGKTFQTTLQTLTKDNNSLLASLFSTEEARNALPKDPSGAVLIDSDPK